jgi:uncharacterized protein
VSTFQLVAFILITVWLVLVVVFFRRSRLVLIGGLALVGVFTLAGVASGAVTWQQLGLGKPASWLLTVILALVWLLVLLAYSPVADRLASRWFAEPPKLDDFEAIRKSKTNLIAGILLAWLLGGVLEELAARGIVLNSLRSLLSPYLGALTVVVVSVLVAALGAGLMHLYQGPRAVVIITQLSVLFGLLFVVSGYNLWAVILCHGLYDTIAFVRFATGKSRWS